MKKALAILAIFMASLFLIACQEKTTTQTVDIDQMQYWRYMTSTEEIIGIEVLDANKTTQEIYFARYYDITENKTLYFAPVYIYADGEQSWNRYMTGYILVETSQGKYTIEQVDMAFLNELFEEQINQEA